MKKLGIIVCLMLVTAFVFAQSSADFVVDKAKSTLNWDAKKVVGGHYGTVNIKEGTMKLNGSKIVAGNFIIDMTSIVCTDAARVTDHLKNADFFDVEKFPTATFIISKIEGTDANPKITGRLTIKGITKDITFPANVTVKNNVFEASANVVINRLDYDIRFRSSNFFENLGDRAIENEFTLKLQIVANAK